MEDEGLEYVDWKTGEKKKVEFGDCPYTSNKILDLICPFDNTPLVQTRVAGYNPSIYCVNCGEQYFYASEIKEGLNQEKVKKIAEKKLRTFKSNLEILDIETERQKSELISKIEQAEKMGITSK